MKMTIKRSAAILAAEAVLLAAVTILFRRFPGVFTSAAAFPLEQIAAGLSALASCGRIGNGAAAALWAGISAIPAAFALRLGKNRELIPEKSALFCLSAAVLLALYGCVDPMAFSPRLALDLPEQSDTIKVAFGLAIWSVFVLYGVLRLTRLLRGSGKERLMKYLRSALFLFCLGCAGAAAVGLADGTASFVGWEKTAADAVVAGLFLAAQTLSYVFDVIIGLRVIDLLKLAEEDGSDVSPARASGDEQVGGLQDAAFRVAEGAEKISRLCRVMLGVTAGSAAALNVAQILLMPVLTDVSVTLNIPILSIVFLVLILLFSRLLAENRQLREDNDLFI